MLQNRWGYTELRLADTAAKCSPDVAEGPRDASISINILSIIALSPLLFGRLYSFVHPSLQYSSTVAQRACYAPCTYTLRWRELCVWSTDFHDNQRCWCPMNRNCDQQTSNTTNVVDNRILRCQRTVVTRKTVADGQISAVRRLSRKFFDRS